MDYIHLDSNFIVSRELSLLFHVHLDVHKLTLIVSLTDTEASVMEGRSISIWRCAFIEEGGHPDATEIETVLNETLDNIQGGAGAAKRRGLSVLRAIVTDQSRLVDKTLEDIDFRATYKSAIIAIQKKDKSEVTVLAEASFAPGDILVLQADDDSPLLVRPPSNFYDAKASSSSGGYNPKNIFNKAVTGLKLSSSHGDLKEMEKEASEDNRGDVLDNTDETEVWADLRVLFRDAGKDSSQDDGGSREFLAATEVTPKSEHIGKTVAEAGLNRQAGLFLVGVERPVTGRKTMRVSFARPSVMPGSPVSASVMSVEDGSVMASITKDDMPKASIPVPPEGHLKEKDILWFAGGATAIADLRKIPGLALVEDNELRQIDEKIHDRRLVQAVVSRKGPLVGKTPGEVGFRTRYGAAVIAVHRDGTRVQDHPGNIKLQGGDVLLLEAG